MLLRQLRFLRLCLLVGAFLVLLSLGATREAFPQTGVPVNGQVKGLQGDPKQFISVSLEGPGRYVAMTNAEGVFTIQSAIPGKYAVHVRQGDRVAVFTCDVGSSLIDLVVNW